MIEGPVNVAIGLTAFEIYSNKTLNFLLLYIPSTSLTTLTFGLSLPSLQPLSTWRSFTFAFFASQSHMFTCGQQSITQFSTGPDPNLMGVYRTIPYFEKVAIETQVRIYLSGVNIQAKVLGQQFTKLQEQYQMFKKLSNNVGLVESFRQALEIEKALKFRIRDEKVLGRLYGFTIETNSFLHSLTYSYIIFSYRVVKQQHNFIIGSFSLLHNQYQITRLTNMDMMFTILNGFTIPQDSSYWFGLSLSQNNLKNESTFKLVSNLNFLEMFFSYIAFEMKLEYVCRDCEGSPIIFESRACVSACPRSYSILEKDGNKFCDKCEVEELKVVDPDFGTCVCAKRHFLVQTSNMCQACRYDCFSCNRADTCLTCDNSFLQTKRKLQNGNCVCPTIGFYDDSKTQNIVCQTCHSSCLTCRGVRQHDCLTCPPSKQLNSLGFCTCKNGYTEDTFGSCSCLPPKFIYGINCLDTSSGNCPPNKIEQFVDITQRCVCQIGYIAILDKCIQCGQNSIFNNQTLACDCVKPMIYINGSCSPCGINKVYNQIYGICECIDGTFSDSQDKCVKCPNKMALFEGKCECIYNYFEVSTNICQRCVKESDGPQCKRNVI